MKRYKDLTGQVFGKLTVIKEIGRRGKYSVLWQCKCHCGNTVRVVSADLNRGKYKSCGKCVKREDINIFDRFGRWTVMELRVKARKGNAVCLCVCECGTEREVLATHLVKGQSQSCGCLQRDELRKRSTIHGLYKSRLHSVWQSMKQRCKNPGFKGYENYGGRGIKYTPEWENFTDFKDWALSHGYNNTLTIERINVNGNYEPQNVTFVTKFEQHRNRRDNKYITFQGQTETLEGWSRITGIPASTIRNRYLAQKDPGLILFKGHLRNDSSK